MFAKKQSKTHRVLCLIFTFFLPAFSFLFSDRVKAASYRVTETEVNAFFGKSITLGNSVVLGFQRFFESKETGYLGGANVIGQGSYNFIAEFTNDRPFMLHYQRKAMKAADIIKATGSKHIFLNMGINDFNTSKEQIFPNYKKYIKMIQTENPDVDIYILAVTPVWKPKGLINNEEIDKLNANMAQFASTEKDVYYIDINTPLKGPDGRLKENAVSDGFLHLRSTAYEIWIKCMTSFVKAQLKAEKKATALVKQAKEQLTIKTYKKAKLAVNALENSSFRTSLKQRLRNIKKRLQKKQEALRNDQIPPEPPMEES